MMLRLIQNELYKMVRLKKLYIFMAILAVHAWLTVYFYNAGGEWKSVIVVPNGQSLPLTLLNSMAQFMIVFIPIYVTDMITSEVNSGTLKLSLLCPVRRIEWLCAKIVSLFAFLVVLLAFSIEAEYVIGTLAFGWGEQTIYAGTLYSQTEGVWLSPGIFHAAAIYGLRNDCNHRCPVCYEYKCGDWVVNRPFDSCAIFEYC